MRNIFTFRFEPLCESQIGSTVYVLDANTECYYRIGLFVGRCPKPDEWDEPEVYLAALLSQILESFEQTCKNKIQNLRPAGQEFYSKASVSTVKCLKSTTKPDGTLREMEIVVKEDRPSIGKVEYNSEKQKLVEREIGEQPKNLATEQVAAKHSHDGVKGNKAEHLLTEQPKQNKVLEHEKIGVIADIRKDYTEIGKSKVQDSQAAENEPTSKETIAGRQCKMDCDSSFAN